MNNNYNKEEKEMRQLIVNMLSSDIQNKQKTEKIINDLADQNFQKIIKICNKLAQNENEDINIRYYSLILLNILISSENGKKYNQINENIKEEIRSSCLALLGNQSDLIRQYSCMVVSSLGQISKNINQKEWPDLIPLLCNGCNSNENKFKLSAIKTLNMIWEKLPNEKDAFTPEELCLMEVSLIKIMNSPPNSEIALESINAYKTFINYISNKLNNLEYLKNTLKLLLKFCNINNNNIYSIDVAKSAIHCITEITKISYEYLDNFIENLFQFFGLLCIGKDEILAIQSYIYFTELSLEEIERKKIDESINEKGLNNKNYIQNNWKLLFNCIQNSIQNYQNNKNNLSEYGDYTRYKALSPLLNNISQLCNENIINEIYNYAFQRMKESDPLIINSGVFILSSTLETIHEYLIIRNISNIIPSLCKFLTLNCHILNNTVGDCLEKICEKFGNLIIGDKSLFIKTSFLLIQLLISQQLKNKPKIYICLCIYNLCNHIKSSSLTHLGLLSPYLNNLLFILDTLAYLPISYDHNSNLAYFSFLTISKLLNISSKNDKLVLQNYFQKLYQRFIEAKDISNFNNGDNNEKQKQFQDFLCICLNEYCNEGNNNANLSPEHIINFFQIIENYFELRKEIFENGLISLSSLIELFIKIKNEKNEKELNYMIDKTIDYIINIITHYKDIQSIKNALDCLSKIIHTIGNKMEKYIIKILNIFEKIILEKEVNKEILGKILIIYSDFFSYENNIIWNYLKIGLTCMQKVINECKKEYEICMMTKLGIDNLKIFVELNDNLMEFIGEILYKISSEKQNLKDFFEKYINDIIQYINKMFNNKLFKHLDDYVLSCLSALIDIIVLYKKKAANMIENSSIENLYEFAENTKDNKIISIKNDLQDRIYMTKHSSLNSF